MGAVDAYLFAEAFVFFIAGDVDVLLRPILYTTLIYHLTFHLAKHHQLLSLLHNRRFLFTRIRGRNSLKFLCCMGHVDRAASGVFGVYRLCVV